MTKSYCGEKKIIKRADDEYLYSPEKLVVIEMVLK